MMAMEVVMTEREKKPERIIEDLWQRDNDNYVKVHRVPGDNKVERVEPHRDLVERVDNAEMFSLIQHSLSTVSRGDRLCYLAVTMSCVRKPDGGVGWLRESGGMSYDDVADYYRERFNWTVESVRDMYNRARRAVEEDRADRQRKLNEAAGL